MYARQITSEETYTLSEAKRIINAERQAKREKILYYAKQKLLGILARHFNSFPTFIRWRCNYFFNYVTFRNLCIIHEREGDLLKGYYTQTGYMGYVEGKYILFASESEYYEYMKERD